MALPKVCKCDCADAEAYCSRRLLLSLAFAALLSSLVYLMRPAHEVGSQNGSFSMPFRCQNAMGDDRPSELMLGSRGLFLELRCFLTPEEPQCTQDTGSSCYLGFCPVPRTRFMCLDLRAPLERGIFERPVRAEQLRMPTWPAS